MSEINGRFPIAPALGDVMDKHADDIAAKFRFCMPGIIQSYDPVKRLASVAPARNFELNDGTVLSVNAPIPDVPVLTLQGGGVHFSGPIEEGDECLLFFADHNIDAWFEAGGQQTPYFDRRHDASDAFALVGPNSLANLLQTFLAAGEGGISSANAKVAINEDDLITVANRSTDLLTALEGLTETLTTLTGPSGSGSVLGVMAALLTATATLTAAVAAMTTASISAGVPQLAAAGVAATLTSVAGEITALATSAEADFAQTDAALEELLYTPT